MKTSSMKSMLACNVYISEGRNPAVLEALELAARSVKEAAVVNVFRDAVYNRTGYTFAAPTPAPIARAVVALSSAALARLDLTAHAATHPRLGVVDHASCHPLTAATPPHLATELAHEIGRGLGGPEPSGRLDAAGTPVLYYGTAHPSGRTLADVRRAFGYFKAGKEGLWTGAAGSMTPPLPPDAGPPTVDPKGGVACVGAVPWVVNYNVALDTEDIGVARGIAKRVSTRGGGLAGVEAMALRHNEGTIEIACNLLDIATTPQAAVLQQIQHHAHESGLKLVDEGYNTNKSAEDIARIAADVLNLARDDYPRP